MLGLKSPAVQGAVCGVIGGAGIIGSVYVLHAIHPHAAIAGFGIGLVGMCVAAELHERRRIRRRDAEFAERRARFIETFERAAGRPINFQRLCGSQPTTSPETSPAEADSSETHERRSPHPQAPGAPDSRSPLPPAGQGDSQ